MTTVFYTMHVPDVHNTPHTRASFREFRIAEGTWQQARSGSRKTAYYGRFKGHVHGQESGAGDGLYKSVRINITGSHNNNHDVTKHRKGTVRYAVRVSPQEDPRM